MYADLLEPNVVPAKVSCESLKSGDATVPTLDSVVTKSDDGRRISVALVNRHPDSAARWKLDLSPVLGAGKARVTVLAGDSPDAYNDVGRPDRVAPEVREVALTGNSVELPPHSVAVLQAAP
jgi:alpha-N-arabinofuranosidase